MMSMIAALSYHPMSMTIYMHFGISHPVLPRLAFYVRPAGHGQLGLFARWVTPVVRVMAFFPCGRHLCELARLADGAREVLRAVMLRRMAS